MEEEQMPMAPIYPTGHNSEGALQYQLETDDIVENILLIFRGYSENKSANGMMVWKKTTTPMLNDLGCDKIRAYLSIILRGQKVFALTDMKEEVIGNEVISIGEDFVRDFEDNYIKYGIENSTTASYIVRWITLITNAVLKKGEDATYLKFLRTTQQINEVQHHQSMRQQQSPEGKSLKDMLFSRKNR